MDVIYLIVISIFKKQVFETLPVIDLDAVIFANLNKDHSDTRSDANSPNGSMEESQCVEEQDYRESTNTEEQNFQNEPDYKIVGLTSNGRIKRFFCV